MPSNPAPSRVVLDTNVLVSGTIVAHGSSAAILDAWHQHRFVLLMSAWQRAELARPRIAHKYHLTDERVAAFLLLADTLTTPVEPLTTLPVVVRDPHDAPILGMALAGQATHLVSGDDDLLTLGGDPALGSLRIVTTRAFMEASTGRGNPPLPLARLGVRPPHRPLHGSIPPASASTW